MRFILILFLFGSSRVYAQSEDIWNLEEDSVKVQKLLDLGYEYEFSDLDSALIIYSLAGEISRKINYKTGLGKSLNYRGIVEFSKGNYYEAEQFYHRSIEVFREIPYPRGIAANYNNLGNIYHYLGEFDQTVQFHMRALAIFEEIRDTLSMILNLNNLGTLYYDNNQYIPAINFYLQSASLQEQLRDTLNLIDTYVSLANTYNRLKDPERTKMYLDRADEIFNEEIGLYGSLLLSDAKREFQVSQGNMQEALRFSTESIELAEKLGSAYDYTRVLTSRGELLSSLNKVPEALDAYSQAIDTANRYNYINLLERLYSGRIALYERNQQYYPAYLDLKHLTLIRDSLYRKERQEIIHEMEARYQNARKQQILEENEVTIARQEFRAARQRSLLIWIAVTSSGILFTVLLGIAFLQQRRKALETKVQNLEKEKELKSLKFIIEGEEKERSRLARELHDGVNGSLGAIKLLTGSGRENQGTSAGNLNKIANLIDQVINEVREISHNLMPDIIIHYGLVEAIEKYLDRISHDRLKTEFQTYGEIEDIDVSLKMTLYRVVQELVRNIISHSGASEGLIQINRHEKNISMIVEDNGGGFNVLDHSRSDKPAGIGLQSIYSRVNLLGGKIDIHSELNSGTSVHIDIPLIKTEA